MKEMVGGCCVCSDDRGWSENPLVYCDGQSCTVAVHQACYGIVTVPTGPWYCRKCESQERSVKVKCELCPSKYGALKRTDNNGWAHVVCALYIPEVRFGNVTTMEPIQLQLIPAERFNKLCYICEEKGKPANAKVGACMQCNKTGCKQQFHVTCAQGLGLLCEEAGNYFDNVKYCGYCEHHYSKLKKGGNVKPIPPYKPVANEAQNSDSNSEKEPEGAPSLKNNISPPNAKKRSSAGGKTVPSKTITKSSNSQSKAVQNAKNSSAENKTGAGKVSSNSRSAKSVEENAVAVIATDADTKDSPSAKREKNEEIEKDSAVVSGKGGKKRKVNSRTPTPVSAGSGEVSVVVSTPAVVTGANVATTAEKKGSASTPENTEKKKVKVDPNLSIVANQPVVALTSISMIKVNSPTVVDTASLVPDAPSPQHQTPTTSQSLVVSVPLVNTTLSPHHGNQVVVGVVPPPAVVQERSNSVGSTTERMSVISGGGNSNSAVLPSELSGGGLKIGYEKQVDSINTEEDMELELDPSPSTIVEEPRRLPLTNEKSERPSRGKKRGSGGGGSSSSTPTPSTVSSRSLPPPPPSSSFNTGASSSSSSSLRRTSRSQHVSPEPPGAFAAVSQTSFVKDIKESPPPSSPSPEGGTTAGRGRPKGRKSAPQMSSNGSDVKDSQDIKLFQNGLTAPHMLGNQLNPSSTMHSKMTDHLNSELEAHSIFNPSENNSNLTGPPLQHKIVQQARASSAGGSSTASGSSGLSNMLGGGGGNIPQTLDQLLERQWEQGSQFLMEQAQHFDIASLLSCLHQLRAENMRLEEHVSSLLQRRDHLLAVNARLAIPLTGQPTIGQTSTANNIHPSVSTTHEDLQRPHARAGNSTARYQGAEQSSAGGVPSHDELSRSSHSRGSSSSRYGSGQHPGLDNGLPESYQQVVASQPSPTVRHSPVGTFQNNTLHRQNSDMTGRTTHRETNAIPRSQSFSLYDRPGPSSQQMVIRERGEREPEAQHLNSTKPS